MSEVSDYVPHDLVPLPTQPWDERPDEYPIGIEEARTALWRCNGNVSRAAALLKVTSMRLRNVVRKSPRLTREVDEARQRRIDKAEEIVDEALDDDQDKNRRDSMARFVLKSENASERGYTTGGKGPLGGIPIGEGQITITWKNGANVSSPAAELEDSEHGKTIDAEDYEEIE